MRGTLAKNSTRLLDAHLEHLGDVLALVADLERLAVVALALADLAGHVHVGQEVHLDLDLPVALAGLAAAALDVEAEAAGLVAAQLALGRLREELADVVEHAGVGGRVAARRAADGRLVDVDDLVEVLGAVDAVVLAGAQLGAPVEARRHALVQDLVDQRGLAGAGDAGDAGERADRERDVDVLEVVHARAAHREPLQRHAPLAGELDAAAPGEVLAGERAGRRP